MKILIVTDNFYPGIGGTEAACLGFASELVAEGNEVMLACPDYHKEDPREYPFPVVRFPSMDLVENAPIVFSAFAGKNLKKLVEFSPDIVHAETLSGMAEIGLKVGRKCGAPVLMTMHTKLLDAFQSYLKSKTLARLLLMTQMKNAKHSDAVVTVAAFMPKIIESYGYRSASPIPVIRNGAMYPKSLVTDGERRAARRELGFGEDENILLYVGHLIKHKNVGFLIDAMKEATDRGFCGKLLLVGSREDEKAFKKQAEKLGIPEKVIFYGVVKEKEQMQRIYGLADLFVTASTFDTDPIVVVEAACRGVPSLVIEHWGCSERVEDGETGFTSPEDPAAFGEKIVQLFSDKEFLREVGRRAADHVPTSWADTVAAHIPLYQRLIEEKRAALQRGKK